MLNRSAVIELATLVALSSTVAAMTTYFKVDSEAAATIYALITDGVNGNLIPFIIKNNQDNPKSFGWCGTSLVNNVTELGDIVKNNGTQLFSFFSRRLDYNATLLQLAGPVNTAAADCIIKSNKHLIHELKQERDDKAFDNIYMKVSANMMAVLMVAALITVTCIAIKDVYDKRKAAERAALLPDPVTPGTAGSYGSVLAGDEEAAVPKAQLSAQVSHGQYQEWRSRPGL